MSGSGSDRMMLVTGGTGQVAQALAQAGGGRRMQVVGRPALDFDRPETIAAVLDAIRPSIVVNAAAYTAVDRAESEPVAAYRANCDAPAAIAAWCVANNARLIHLSTDYVFNGEKGQPYQEADDTAPTCVYGASKLAGEEAVLKAGAQTLILRTSWVFAPVGRNFVLTMLAAARKTNRLRVVADQFGCPTAAADLATAILSLADMWEGLNGGIYHAAGSGATTWYGLAEAVFARAERHGLKRPELEPITTADWPTPARRPPDSRLDCSRLQQTFEVTLPHWKDSVARTVDAVLG